MNNITKDDTIHYIENSHNDTLTWGRADGIDTETHKMTIRLIAGAEKGLPTILPIKNLVTNYGSGLRVMPKSFRTAVRLSEEEGYYTHDGYVTDDIGELTDSRLGDKQENNESLLLRHLNEGEIQLGSHIGSELFLTDTGDLLLKNQFGASIKLDNYFSRNESNYASKKEDMDGVRIRAGNVIRPTKTDTTEDQYVFLSTDNETIIQQDELTEENVTNDN